MTAPTTSTPQNSQPDRLDFHRMRRLDTAAMAATTLTAVAAVCAWLLITQWAPATFLPDVARHGLRFWLLAVLYGYALLRTIEAVWDRTHAESSLALGAATTPIPVQPLGRWLGLLSLALSMPLWPRIATAIEANDASLLASIELAKHAALLATPVAVLALLGHGAIAGVAELRWTLQIRQKQEQPDTKADVGPIVG